MSLRVYDTCRRAKIPFPKTPPDRVGIYVCGMTVQDKPHVGHMRYAISGDVIRRYLEWKGFRVTYVTNFTDIDDRIIQRATEERLAFQEVAERNVQAFLTYARRLNIKDADVYPRATQHIPEILALIGKLIEGGHAYAASGDVYFDVRSYARYGELSGHDVDELRSGVRIEVGEAKRDPLDFTLWKGAKPGEPSWPSPWGPGRPGWHIECSAMAMKYLGESFDFHGGGQDLIFPHHENEKAQSEAATGKTFAAFWVENGMVNLGGEKMSKSTKHFFLAEDVLKEVDPEVVRFYLQSTHYRSPIEWNEDRLREAGAAYGRLRAAIAAAKASSPVAQPSAARPAVAEPASIASSAQSMGVPRGPTGSGADSALLSEVEEAARQFQEAMEDDFNSARAQGHLFEMAKAIYRVTDAADAAPEDLAALPAAGRKLDELGRMIGLFWGEGAEEEVPEEVQLLVKQRDEARLQKDWRRADELRDQIMALGFVLDDQKGGTRARRKS